MVALTIVAVKSSGAVSPAARATASSDAGDDARAAPSGSTTRATTRQRGAPSASAASRSESGTSSSTTSAERVTTGSISSASATEPFQPAKLPPTPLEDQRDVDEEAEDDRRHAGQHVDEVAHDVREAAVLAVLGQVERDADADRDRDRGRQRHDLDRAEDRALDAARVAEEAARSGRS